jgi:hypothetical protein
MTFRVAFLALVVAAALALAFGEGSAKAAAPSGGISNPSLAWTGQYFALPVINPTLCLAAALDPLNATCDHFTLDVGAPGTERVSISWADPANDFDLYVYDSAGKVVTDSSSDTGTSETVSFPAAAGRYEVRVVPFFVVASGYAGTASWSSTLSPASNETLRFRMDGGGLLVPTTAKESQFELDVRSILVGTTNQRRFRGKVRFREGDLFLRAVEITNADGIPYNTKTGDDDGDGHFTVQGTAICDSTRQAKPFTLEADDAIAPQPDSISLNAPDCIPPVEKDSTFVKGKLQFRQHG